MIISAPIGLGELYDKISILEIKSEKIKDEGKLIHIRKELTELRKIAARYPIDETLYARLKEVNTRLWGIEDTIRIQESKNDFGEEFIRLARSVYITNDRRAEIKKEINTSSDSDIVEIKSYEPYSSENKNLL